MSTTEAPPARQPAVGEPDDPRAPATRPEPDRRHLRIGTWFAITRGLLLVVALVGGIAGVVALTALTDARRDLLDQVGPTRTASLQLEQAVLDQETGLRGFVLTGRDEFLEPFELGTRDQAAAATGIRRFEDQLGIADEAEGTIAAADAWREEYALPTIAAVRRGERPDAPEELLRGKVLFDELRSVNAGLRDRMDRLRLDGRDRLNSSATTVMAIVIAFVALILLSVIGTAIVLRRQVIKPLTALAGRVRGVAAGDHDQRIAADGAREIHELGTDVEEMRARIVQEIDALEEAQTDLKRSNTELEQFAYVASHDLQEPLRKVASFCQMLQKRYGGQLDERGEQYIEFAVDGAKRMQELINDLLAFSRVGRVTEPPVVITGDEILDRVRRSLAASLEARNGRVDAEPLPPLRGEASLLTLVFQNLVANGLKFQADGVDPVVRVGVERDDDMWRFTVADNGIGIEAEYAERIFVIFQRLHPRSAYEGTGIGLAMCRKVIEHHGGRIWLDTDVAEGATFHFTLPVLEEESTQ